ncbi:MAG: stage V sporulation protein AC [Defluviitaleaceae bacterium]|nr:stage V sporulation protein AC [Defluviitaleaceae bacterium]
MVSKQEYDNMVKKASPNSKIFPNCLKAFFVGGLICVFGQSLHDFFEHIGVAKDNVGAWVAITLIFIAILLTGLGVFDNIVSFAGAGAAVPITGFANAMAAPAIEFKKEGYIFGVGAKMFVIAGPVIVYGTVASMIVGAVHYIVQKWG